MKHFSLLILAFMLITTNLFAQIDSLDYVKTITELNARIERISLDNKQLSSANDALAKRINWIDAQIQSLKGESAAQSEKDASLEASINKNAETISANANELGVKIDNTKNDVDTQSSNLRKKTIWGLIIAFIVLAISALITVLFHKKGSDQIEALKMQSEKISEDIINKFSKEMSDMQNISSSIGSLSAAGASTASEQDLIKALADRITFMEMTLFKMDNTVRGHKHLCKSIAQMKDNLLASGYEIVDMLGKPYHDGMKVTANFIEDDTLQEGEQKITGITKPQINYQGKMIQAAQITVSQNI